MNLETPLPGRVTTGERSQLQFGYVTDIFLKYGRAGAIVMDETKNERFRRLANNRGLRLMNEIRLIGNLSNRKNYDYDRDDVERLFSPIEEQLKEAKTLFERGVEDIEKGFFE